MSHVKPKIKKSFSIMLRVIFFLNTAYATFYENTNLHNQKNGKVFHEESSVASHMSCVHRCDFKDSNALVVFNQGFCQCVKKRNEENLAPISGLWLRKPIKMFWKRVIIFEKQRQIQKGKYYTTLPKLTKQYRISFEIKPTSYKDPGFRNVLDMQGRDVRFPRTPRLSFHRDGEGVITSCHVAHSEVGYACNKTKTTYPAGKWLSVKITQLRDKGQRFSFKVIIDGEVGIQSESVMAREIADVKVSVSGNFHPAQKGLIRNLFIDIES